MAAAILVLIERLQIMYALHGSPIVINSQTVHREDLMRYLIVLCFYRLVLTAIVITQKMYNDGMYSNGLLARVGGIPLEQLNK